MEHRVSLLERSGGNFHATSQWHTTAVVKIINNKNDVKMMLCCVHHPRACLPPPSPFAPRSAGASAAVDVPRQSISDDAAANSNTTVEASTHRTIIIISISALRVYSISRDGVAKKATTATAGSLARSKKQQQKFREKAHQLWIELLGN